MAESESDLESQQTPHISPSRGSYGVPIVSICEKTDHIIMAPFMFTRTIHCYIISDQRHFFFTHIHFSFTSWQVQQQVHFELLESVCVIPILILGELFQSVMVPVGSILDAVFLSGEKLKITSLKWDISHRWLSKRLCISIGDTTGLQ